MANFTTHIGVGTIASGMLATLTLAADVVAPENLVAVTMVGVLGSVLPDIDLKDSRPGRAMFSGLAVFFSFAVLFLLAEKLSIAELWIVWLATFFGVRYGAHAIFHRMSYHRGIYHSVLAALFFAFFTAVVFKYLLGRHDGVAWLAAAFMFIGYMIHLLLDEIYSVDVMDTRIKRSFGTAIKLYDSKHMGHTAAMATAMILAFAFTPSTKTFVEGVASKSLWAGLQDRFLPKDKWFGVVGDVDKLVRWHVPASTAGPAQPGSNPIETGSLPRDSSPAPAK